MSSGPFMLKERRGGEKARGGGRGKGGGRGGRKGGERRT